MQSIPLNAASEQLIGTGACAKVYRDGDVAVKLFNERYPLAQVLREADAMARVSAQTDLPVPRMRGVRHEKSRWAIAMDYVSGAPIFDETTCTPERLSRMIAIQMKIHACRVSLPDTVHDRLTRALGRSPLTAPQREVLVKRLERLPRGEALIHADFHPLNVLVDGDSYAIIDWINACVGAPAYDIARTSILLMPASVELANGYISEITARERVPQEDVRAWLPLVAAERLGENQPSRVNTRLLRLINDV